MGSFKSLALAGVFAVAASATALAADLLPPPPPDAAIRRLRRSSSASGWYLRGDVGVGALDFDKFEGVDTNPAFVGPPAGLPPRPQDDRRSGLRRVRRRLQVQQLVPRRPHRRVPHGGPVQDRRELHLSAPRSRAASTSSRRSSPRSSASRTAISTSATATASRPSSAPASASPGTRCSGSPTSAPAPPPGGIGFAPDRDTTKFAWALHAGVGMAISPNAKLELAYRYLNMGKAETGGAQLLQRGRLPRHRLQPQRDRLARHQARPALDAGRRAAADLRRSAHPQILSSITFRTRRGIFPRRFRLSG